MAEFIPRRQPSRIAELIAQFGTQPNPIAQGILQAGQSIGQGLESRGVRNHADIVAERGRVAAEGARKESGIMALLGSGTFTDASGTPIPLELLLPGVVPAGTKYVPSTNKKTKEEPPPGYRFLPNGSLEAIPGGPGEDRKVANEEKRAALRDKEESARQTVLAHAGETIDAATKALGIISEKTAGFGSMLKGIPKSDARTLAGYIDTLKAKLAFEQLQQMRAQSKTGGALGNVSDNELRLLSSAVASLDQGQDPEILRERISKVKAQAEGVLEKMQSSSAPTGKAGGKDVSKIDSLIDKHLGGQ